MIVPMARAFVACRGQDRDRLLARLHQLGVLHIVPAASLPESNGEDPDAALKQVETAAQVLRTVEPQGPEPQLAADAVVAETLALWQGCESARARLDALHREVEQLRPWGDTRLDALHAIAAAGVDLQVLVVPESALSQLRATVLRPLERLPHHRRLVAAIGLDATTLPRGAELLPLPARDRRAVQEEAAALEAELRRDRRRLAQLAWLLPSLDRERDRLAVRQAWAKAARSGLAAEGVYAVQGWLPAERADALAAELARAGLDVAVRISAPADDDLPPTLIRYRPWAKPIDGLFRILGMVPGYRELDASTLFVVALPLFAGMIIGDAGYGLLFVLAPLLLRRSLERTLGRDLRVLVMLFGIAAVLWGAITGTWFGLTPAGLVEHGGGAALLGRALFPLQLVRGSDDEVRMLLIRICFVLGTTHLILAHLRRGLALAPHPRALAELGWCVVLGGMLGLIWILFFGSGGGMLGPVSLLELAGGLALVTAFSHPERPLASRLGMGLAGSLLPVLGTFSDTLSYIRLMAVGLAGYYLASTFNLLAGTAAEHSWLAGAAILLFGHTLNLALILIAIFAHGVRLNVLEFSSNAGIQWAGYPYEPFADLVKEH